MRIGNLERLQMDNVSIGKNKPPKVDDSVLVETAFTPKQVDDAIRVEAELKIPSHCDFLVEAEGGGE